LPKNNVVLYERKSKETWMQSPVLNVRKPPWEKYKI